MQFIIILIIFHISRMRKPRQGQLNSPSIHKRTEQRFRDSHQIPEAGCYRFSLTFTSVFLRVCSLCRQGIKMCLCVHTHVVFFFVFLFFFTFSYIYVYVYIYIYIYVMYRNIYFATLFFFNLRASVSYIRFKSICVSVTFQ